MDLLNGILSALSPDNLLYALVGSLIGTMVGVLPGIGSISAVAILFPFTAYLPPDGMIITMAAIFYGSMYGGSTTAILMNVPGEVSSVVTAFDGYAMTKQGRPGPALAISAITSFIAGIIGSVLIAIIGPSVARLAFSFGPAEYLGLALFGMTAISALSGNSILKAFIVAILGMILVSVGIDMSDVPRLTFGQIDLLLGFELAPMMIGLFGVAEVFGSLERGKPVTVAKLGKLMPTFSELKTSVGAALRATVVSFPLGMLPGMATSICSFLAYQVERKFSKTPERFGKGAIEGVSAAEAANNAAGMAHFVPLLSLGIPTGATMALLLAAFNMYGLAPGPTLFTQYSSLVWTVIGSFFVANIIMLVLNLPLVGLWARLITVPYPVLAPIILSLCAIGSYVPRNSLFDVWVCFGFGIFGWLLNKRDWPVAPLVLAYVLGPIIEQSARQVWSISPSLLLERPVFWAFIAAGALAVLWSRSGQAVEARTGLAAREDC